MRRTLPAIDPISEDELQIKSGIQIGWGDSKVFHSVLESRILLSRIDNGFMILFLQRLPGPKILAIDEQMTTVEHSTRRDSIFMGGD